MRRALLIALSVVGFTACDKVDYIELSPDSVMLRQPNNEVWLSAKAMSRQGRQGIRISVGWVSADPSIATVDSTGKVKPVKSGHTEIIATYKGVEARVPVDVVFTERVEVEPKEVSLVEGGEPVELHAKGFDYRGKPLTDRTPTFSVTDKKIASMGQNAVFPMGVGKTEVVVQVDGIKASVQVTVAPEKKGAVANKK